MPAGSGKRNRRGSAPGIYGEVSFHRELATARRVGADFLTPRGLTTLAASRLPVRPPSQSGHAHATAEASPDAACATRPRPAAHASVASKSYLYRNRVPVADSPTYLYVGCRLMLCSHQPRVGDRLWVMT
jgi:hypothetical protein